MTQTTASSAWQAAIAGGASGNSGQATALEAAEIDDDGGGGAATTDPVNPSLPRPVNSGHSWKMSITGVFPRIFGSGASYGITVTLFAVCE